MTKNSEIGSIDSGGSSDFQRSEASPTQYAEWGRRVLRAHDRIRSYVERTPIEDISEISAQDSVRVFAKMENRQETGSFKLRGATNKIRLLTPDEASAGIIAASNGNHGLGVAAAAKRAGVRAEIYVSAQVAPNKVKRIEEYGAKISVHGSEPLDTELAAREAASETARVFVSPYNDHDVMAGQGTLALELKEQIPHLDAVFAAVGGGGLVGGIGAYLKWVSPETEIVGCWPENSAVLYESLKAGRIVSCEEQPTLSESTAGGLEEGSVTLDVCRAVVDSCVLVSEAEILKAMRLMHQSRQWLVEGAAGVALASFLKVADRYVGKTVAIVICGANLSEKVRSEI
jgi:threonine dehydratase